MAQFKEIDDYNFPFEIGVMRDRGAALKFADYLNSIGIKATAKPGFGANYSIYVANEADVSKAKLELLRFGNNPFAKAYNQAAWSQGKTPKRERTVSSNASFLSFSMGTYTWSLASLTSIIEVICLLIFVLSLVPSLENALLGALSWYHWDQVVADFQVWRVLTPIFLHFGIIHILFNLVMFEAFARPIERHFGAWKIGYIILTIALVSNILQFIFLQSGLGANAIFGGLSGVVYGVIGYMGVLSRRQDLPSDLRLPPGLLLVSAIFIGIGFLFSGIANICHLGGLLVGMALALVDFKRPLR